MSKTINLKRGLNVPLSGEAARKLSPKFNFGEVALKPTDFRGMTPKLLVKEDERVLAGSPLFAAKGKESILFTSPVSGVVSQIVRGERRKLLEVRIKADKEQKHVHFDIPEKLTAENVKELLLTSGLWPNLVQRPYGVVADPATTPKAIFVSTFSSAPCAADLQFTLSGELGNMQKGIDSLAILCPEAKIHLGLCCPESIFATLQGCEKHVFKGPHPAGNVGVQIHHIDPVQKGSCVWTLSPEALARIGKFFATGEVDYSVKVALTGPMASTPQYISGVVGLSMKDISTHFMGTEHGLRVISGNALSGKNIGENGFLGFYDNQVTLLAEGRYHEMFGWAKPMRCSQFSSSRTYFSWLTPNRKYDMDTNLHGGERAFVLSDVYSKVLPMDIYPVHLAKACLAKDIDKMEQLGIYEVLEEDFALCEYVDPCKIDIQQIIAEGIELMIKEMA